MRRNHYWSLSAEAAPLAQKKYDIGATDTEIKIGNIMPYSGPASAYGVSGRTEAAYFRKINAEGGINGRKINFISYDDAYSPPKAVEQARKLVESDEVLMIFGPLGTPSNTAIQKYMNTKRVPHLLVATGATKWNDPQNYPWTMGWQPSYQNEARVYAKYILRVNQTPGSPSSIRTTITAKIISEVQRRTRRQGSFDYRFRRCLRHLRADHRHPYRQNEVMKADVFVDIARPKFAAQAIRKAAEIGWRPCISSTTSALRSAAVIRPAGLENAQGIISVADLMDPLDPQWKDDPGMKAFDEFLAKDYPEGDRADT